MARARKEEATKATTPSDKFRKIRALPPELHKIQHWVLTVPHRIAICELHLFRPLAQARDILEKRELTHLDKSMDILVNVGIRGLG